MTDVRQILEQKVYIRGANRSFAEPHHRGCALAADELGAAVGFGPIARVAPVAQAWRELAIAMDGAGARTVADLDAAVLVPLRRGCG